LNSNTLRAAALCLVAAGAFACKTNATPTPEKEPPAPSAQPSAATVVTSPSARASGEAAEAPVIPTLALEKFAPGGVHPSDLYPVEGALMVAEERRVGRIADEGIEWIGKIHAGSIGLGPTRIDSVRGRWPDTIGVLYSTVNGRAPQPTYQPLKGVAEEYTAAPGGGLGQIYGVARLGDSVLVVAYSYEGIEFKTVRGTAVRKPQTPDQAGCKAGEIKYDFRGTAPAISPKVLESTPEGTLVSLGRLCEERGPAAEVWDKAGKSRIIDLSRFWKKLSYWPKIVKGAGDELWAFSDGWAPVLHYKNGEFEAVQDLERPIQNIFVSPSGKLHANDGRTIHRYEGDKWVPAAHLAVPASFSEMAMDDKETIWVGNGGVYRLRPTTQGAAAPVACATPFVYLYEVSSKNEKNYSYPSTRKALSTFAEVDAIGLVEFTDSHEKRLGITVTSRAQGEAVIAHVKETMKDESPRLLCFKPEQSVRKIDMSAKK
jgi:hypothetical protein